MAATTESLLQIKQGHNTPQRRQSMSRHGPASPVRSAAANTGSGRIPYSRYGYRPPGSTATDSDRPRDLISLTTEPRSAYSVCDYRQPGSTAADSGSGGGHRSPRAATQRSYLPCAPTPAPAEPEQSPLDAPPAYETLAPLGPPSYETVCRELATQAAEPTEVDKK